jgi:A/G-specific adenine glycosylase
MEHGALVSTPQPRCDACPLAKLCEARRLGLQEEIPVRATPGEIIEVNEVAVVVRRGEKVLLAQRSAVGRWANMWEFPHGPLNEEESHEAAAMRLLTELTSLHADVGAELETVRHGVTRFRIAMVCFEAAYRAGRFTSAFYQRGIWLRPDELHTYPVSVSAPQRRLAKLLVDQGHQRRLF